MIQVFQISINVLKKNKYKKNYIVSSLFFTIFTFLYINSDFEKNEILKDTSANLFTFSGIFSAILITFIISKIFQIRNEKRELKIKIINLCNKVTDFRRICEKIINNYDVWDASTKSKLDNKYKHLTYQHLYDDYQKTNLKN